MLKQVQKGFTLIELMIVVAIIGILAAIAIPAYQDYTIRSQVTEGLNLASAVKASVAEYYAQNGSWPPTLVEAGLVDAANAATPPSGKYVSGITLGNGTIKIVFSSAAPQQANSNINAAELDLRPTVSVNGDVIWTCGKKAIVGTDPAAPITAADADATTVLAKYLPSSCRP
jgi:type IV pilus assembly protein PilA